MPAFARDFFICWLGTTLMMVGIDRGGLGAEALYGASLAAVLAFNAHRRRSRT